MAKFNVETIKQDAIRTRLTYRGRSGSGYAKDLKIWQMRVYIDKVLFLCKEIEKLNKRLAP